MTEPQLVRTRADFGAERALLVIRTSRHRACLRRTVSCRKGTFKVRIGGRLYGGRVTADNQADFRCLDPVDGKPKLDKPAKYDRRCQRLHLALNGH